MALQDLTPQLRTRLSRMERAVGWFVALAIGLLAFGFVYYVYHTAESKGWFLTKARYYTYSSEATGLKVGDPVMLMGLTVGQIIRMEPMPPEFPHNIYVEFEIKDPYYGYIWTQGSKARITAADLLGKRMLEVTKGTGGYPTYVFSPLREVSIAEARAMPDLTNWVLAQEVFDQTGTNLLAKPKTPVTNLTAVAAAGCTNLLIMDRADKRTSMTGIWDPQEDRYAAYSAKSKPYELPSLESAAVTERLEKLVSEVERALPNIFSLTNQLITVLSNSASLTSNLNVVAVSARPAVSNLAVLTAQINQPGALGEWLLPTNINHRLEDVLGNANTALLSAHTTLAGANTNLTTLAENLGRSLDNLANLTSNLNTQVQANTNILAQISQVVVDADSFVQGIKHFWLWRSYFRAKPTNAAPAIPPEKLRSPKDRSERER
jgi:ABC-type transporter Mla subunit MlaD